MVVYKLEHNAARELRAVARELNGDLTKVQQQKYAPETLRTI